MNKKIDDMTSEEIFDEVHDLRVKGHFDQAITLMFHLLSRDMRDSDVILYLATLLAEDMQFERAERMFQHLFKLGGDSTVIRYNYAMFLASSGHPLEARDRLHDEGRRLTQLLQQLERSEAEDAAERVEEARTALDRVNQSLDQVQQELGSEAPRAVERLNMLHERFDLPVPGLDASDVPGDRQRQTSLQFGSADLPLFRRGE